MAGINPVARRGGLVARAHVVTWLRRAVLPRCRHSLADHWTTLASRGGRAHCVPRDGLHFSAAGSGGGIFRRRQLAVLRVWPGSLFSSNRGDRLGPPADSRRRRPGDRPGPPGRKRSSDRRGDVLPAPHAPRSLGRTYRGAWVHTTVVVVRHTLLQHLPAALADHEDRLWDRPRIWPLHAGQDAGAHGADECGALGVGGDPVPPLCRAAIPECAAARSRRIPSPPEVVLAMSPMAGVDRLPS